MKQLVLSDQDLVQAYIKGDQSAIETLINRHRSKVYTYILLTIKNQQLAEDLFQETFLRVYTHLDSFRVTARFRPWVCKIATNLCKDHLKYRRRHPQISLDAAIGSEDGSETALDRMEAPIPNPTAPGVRPSAP